MSKYAGHIHSMFPGTGGWSAGLNSGSLRINKFDWGVGWQEYGPTGDTKFWALIDPPYSGLTAFGLGLSGQTAGIVVYEYKAANGPSIHSFDPQAGSTAFLNYTKSRGGITAGATAAQALNWYVGNTGAAVVTNIFKSIPFPKNLVYAWDVDQGLSVIPDPANVVVPSVTTYDMTQKTWPVTMTYSIKEPALNGALRSVPQPWNISWLLGSDADFSSAPSTALVSAEAFSVSIWARVYSSAVNYNMFYLYDASGYYVSMYYDASGDRIMLDYDLGGSPNTLRFTIGGGYTSKWQNFTIVVSGDEVYTYVDNGGVDSGPANATVSFGPILSMTIGDPSNNQQAWQFNSIYMWDMNIVTEMPTLSGTSGLTFFYDSSKDGFIR